LAADLIDCHLRFARCRDGRFFCHSEQARAQTDWIASTGKNLTTIYATHGHGDHFFGASVLLGRFPKARFVATPSAIQVMKEQTAPEYLAKFWEPPFPNQLPKRLEVAQELSTNVIDLEGERLIVIPLGFTDTAGTACLHVPSLQLIAAGDAAYNGVHPRLNGIKPESKTRRMDRRAQQNGVVKAPYCGRRRQEYEE
jgi:glyoxylase-like metal-dependent hydrolase (beta-lactamase superfamily II)